MDFFRMDSIALEEFKIIVIAANNFKDVEARSIVIKILIQKKKRKKTAKIILNLSLDNFWKWILLPYFHIK